MHGSYLVQIKSLLNVFLTQFKAFQQPIINSSVLLKKNRTWEKDFCLHKENLNCSALFLKFLRNVPVSLLGFDFVKAEMDLLIYSCWIPPINSSEGHKIEAIGPEDISAEQI